MYTDLAWMHRLQALSTLFFLVFLFVMRYSQCNSHAKHGPWLAVRFQDYLTALLHSLTFTYTTARNRKSFINP
jgi:hypothetical protein